MPQCERCNHPYDLTKVQTVCAGCKQPVRAADQAALAAIIRFPFNPSDKTIKDDYATDFQKFRNADPYDIMCSAPDGSFDYDLTLKKINEEITRTPPREVALTGRMASAYFYKAAYEKFHRASAAPCGPHPAETQLTFTIDDKEAWSTWSIELHSTPVPVRTVWSDAVGGPPPSFHFSLRASLTSKTDKYFTVSAILQPIKPGPEGTNCAVVMAYYSWTRGQFQHMRPLPLILTLSPHELCSVSIDDFVPLKDGVGPGGLVVIRGHAQEEDHDGVPCLKVVRVAMA